MPADAVRLDAVGGLAPSSFLGVDPLPLLAGSSNAAISFFARRDLGHDEARPVSDLWELAQARPILRRQRDDGSWRYPGGKPHVRSQENYDQLETFRQLGELIEKLGFTREHPAVERAASYLFSFQSEEGDFRGIYGNQYATTYVGAITELLVKAGYARDRRVAAAFRWLLSMRQDDGGWAIPWRTLGIGFSESIDPRRHPRPRQPDRCKPSSHLVTGMVLRALAAHPTRRTSAQARRAAELLASRLYERDHYGDRGEVAYWERVSYPFWFTDVVSALDSLSRIGIPTESPKVAAALARVRDLQRPDGTFAFKLVRGRDRDLPWWVCLAVCRSLERWSRTGL